MADESVTTKTRAEESRRELPADLCIEICKATVLSRLALQEISETEITRLDSVFARSNISADNFVSLLVALRDTINEICRIGGVPT